MIYYYFIQYNIICLCTIYYRYIYRYTHGYVYYFRLVFPCTSYDIPTVFNIQMYSYSCINRYNDLYSCILSPFYEFVIL